MTTNEQIASLRRKQALRAKYPEGEFPFRPDAAEIEQMYHDAGLGHVIEPQRGTNGAGPVMEIKPRESRLTRIGFYDAGQIVPAPFPEPAKPLLVDDVVTTADGDVWRIVSDGRSGRRMVCANELWQWQADRALLADLVDTYHDVSPEGQ